MRTHPWLKHGPRLLFPALLLWLVACSSGGTTGDNAGGSTAMSSSGAPAQVGTGGSTAVAGAGAPASGGMSVSVGGSAAGGASGAAGSVSSSAGAAATDACASVTCPSGQYCTNGACACMPPTSGLPLMACADGCFDLPNDQNHCGSCTNKCAADGACVSGACVTPTCNPDTMQRSGKITTYNLATPMVACHYPTSTLPQYYGAMNEYDWNNAGVCGSCVEITNSQNQKKLVVQITDQCPYKGNEQWCKQGSHHIDLNSAAYGALGANNNPSVTWKFVPCNSMGNIKYYFDKAVQQYYLAVTPINARNPLAKVEVQVGTEWKALTRNTSNMYELAMGAGVGELKFRLTDIYNHVITDNVVMAAEKVVDGTKQFAACP